jgi:hypothetical protein
VTGGKFETRESYVRWLTAHGAHKGGCPLTEAVMVPSAPGFPDWSECTCI